MIQNILGIYNCFNNYTLENSLNSGKYNGPIFCYKNKNVKYERSDAQSKWPIEILQLFISSTQRQVTKVGRGTVQVYCIDWLMDWLIDSLIDWISFGGGGGGSVCHDFWR